MKILELQYDSIVTYENAKELWSQMMDEREIIIFSTVFGLFFILAIAASYFLYSRKDVHAV